MSSIETATAIARRHGVRQRVRTRATNRELALRLVGAVVVAVLVGAYTAALMGDAPTGNDPANWLARGSAMWSGEAQQDDFARPLVPTAVYLLSLLIGPIVALNVVGVASVVLVSLAVFGVLRPVGLPIAIAAAIVAGVSRPVVETAAFGGYPQNFALAGSLVSTALCARFVRSESRVRMWWLAAALAFVALSHHVYFALTLLGCAVVLLRALLTHTGRTRLRARWRALLAAFVVAVMAFLPTLLAFSARGYEPSGLGALGFEASLGYMFGDARPLYAVVFAVGGAYATYGAWRRGASDSVLAGGALLLVAAVAFAASHEPRLLALALVGALVCVGAFAAEFARSLPGGAGRWVALTTPVLALTFATALVSPNREVFAYYRVFDDELDATLAFVRDEPEPGAVAVAPGRDGWPTGWWFRALGERPALTGAASEWLAFPDERDEAAVVEAIVGAVTSREAAERAEQANVRFVAGDQGSWLTWKSWLSEARPVVSLVYQDARYVVLRFDWPEAAR